jgi:hypothetical protein
MSTPTVEPKNSAANWVSQQFDGGATAARQRFVTMYC